MHTLPGRVRLVFPSLPGRGIPTYTLSQEAGGFCQVNPEQNRRMIERMLVWLEGCEVATVGVLARVVGWVRLVLAASGLMAPSSTWVTGDDRFNID